MCVLCREVHRNVFGSMELKVIHCEILDTLRDRGLLFYAFLLWLGVEQSLTVMSVDLSPLLGGHTVANQPPTTVLLSFTFILPPRNVVRPHSTCGTES